MASEKIGSIVNASNNFSLIALNLAKPTNESKIDGLQR